MDGNALSELDFGVCLFDDPKAPMSGSTCRIHAGEALVARCQAPGDLGTDTLWYTNVDYDEYRQCLSTHPWARNSGYLRAPMKALFEEWGVDGQPAPDRVVFAARLIDRLARRSRDLLDPGLDFRSETFADDLVKLIPVGEQPPTAASQAISECLQAWTSVPTRPVRGVPVFSLRRNRLAHARDLLSIPRVHGPWTWISDEAMGDNPVQWLLARPEPYIVRLALTDPLEASDPEHVNLFAFGGGAKARDNQKMRRQFATDIEFREAALLYHMEIRGAWMGSRYGAPLMGEGIVAEHLEDPLSIVSWTDGLIAENLLAAAMKPSRYGRDRTHGFQAAWLRAADRMACFRMARLLRTEGALPYSYGMGAIRLGTPDAFIPAVLDLAWASGWTPAWGVPQSVLWSPPPFSHREGDDPLAHIEAAVRANSNFEAFETLDTLRDQDDAAIDAILNGFRRYLA